MNSNMNINLDASTSGVMREIKPNVFVIDVRTTNNRIVSFENTQPYSWILESNVIVSLQQLTAALATEYTNITAQLKSKIQSSYVVNLWPLELTASVLQNKELMTLPKLRALFLKPGAPSLAILNMLIDKHQCMMRAAAEASTFARIGEIEQAYEVLYGRFDAAAKVLIATLRILSGDAFVGQPISALVPDVASMTFDPLPINGVSVV